MATECKSWTGDLRRLPPAEFSHAMNIIYGGNWYNDEWQNLKEWKLWCAGRKAQAQYMIGSVREVVDFLEKEIRT
jgi:hypothetical protein